MAPVYALVTRVTPHFRADNNTKLGQRRWGAEEQEDIPERCVMPRLRNEKRQHYAPREVRQDICEKTSCEMSVRYTQLGMLKHGGDGRCARKSVIPVLKIVYPPKSPSSSIMRRVNAIHSPTVRLRQRTAVRIGLATGWKATRGPAASVALSI